MDWNCLNTVYLLKHVSVSTWFPYFMVSLFWPDLYREWLGRRQDIPEGNEDKTLSTEATGSGPTVAMFDFMNISIYMSWRNKGILKVFRVIPVFFFCYVYPTLDQVEDIEALVTDVQDHVFGEMRLPESVAIEVQKHGPMPRIRLRTSNLSLSRAMPCSYSIIKIMLYLFYIILCYFIFLFVRITDALCHMV